MDAALPLAAAFALLGDVPYSQPQANLLEGMIDRINAARPAFVVHIGDITSGTGPCGDEWLLARKRQFERFAAPFVLLPGDNEWTDCHRSGFEPQERLKRWRDLFCVPVPAIALKRQKGTYCENVRWVHDNHVFVGLHVTGSNNNAGRDPLESGARMAAVLAWLDEAERLARGRDGLVVLLHANPFVAPRLGGPNGFESLVLRLRRLGETMPGRVLLVHGDTHTFRDDEPLPGIRRIEVHGSPHLRWTRAQAERDGPQRFRVEPAPPE